MSLLGGWVSWTDIILPGSTAIQKLLRKTPKGGDPITEQTSIYGTPLPLGYGRNRIGANVIHFGMVSADGNPVPNPAKAPAILALCEGENVAIERVFRQRQWFYTPAQAGFSYYTGGWPTGTGTPWPWLTTNYPDAAIVYPRVAYVAREDFPVDAVGAVPYQFEVSMMLSGTGGTDGDAKASLVAKDVLTAVKHGVGLPTNRVIVETGRDGTAASSYDTYVAAEGFHISPVWVQQKSARECLQQDVLDCTNATIIQTAVIDVDGTTRAVLEVVPYGDQAVGSYTPCLTIRYNLDETDYHAGSLTTEQNPESEVYNTVSVSFRDRSPASIATDPSNSYIDTPVEGADPLDVARHGTKPSGVQSMPAICQRATAQKIARIMAQRSVRQRTKFGFEFPSRARFSRLEPMDFVTIQNGLFGLAPRTVRVISVEEDFSTSTIKVEAEDYSELAATAAEHETPSPESLYTVPPDVDAVIEPPRRDEFDHLRDDVTNLQVISSDQGAALALAGSKTAVFFTDDAPTSPVGGYTLRANDLWFNKNTTSNCPDPNCKGHTAANGAPQVGTYPHRGIYWPHRWTDTGGGVYAWRDTNRGGLVIASEIAAGAIVADKIAANAISAQRILVGDYTNLFPNGRAGEALPVGYGTSGGWLTVPSPYSINDPEYAGTYSAGSGGFSGNTWVRRLVRSASTTAVDLPRRSVRCAPGEAFSLYASVNCVAYPTSFVGAVTILRFSNAAGQVIDKLGVADPYRAGGAGEFDSWLRQTGWTRIGVAGVAPPNAYSVEPVVGFNNGAANEVGTDVYFDAISFRRVGGKGEVVADMLTTSNYAEDASGNPIAGAKMEANGRALKVAPANLQLGKRVLSDFGLVRAQGKILLVAGYSSYLVASNINIESAAHYYWTDKGQYVIRVFLKSGYVPVDAIVVASIQSFDLDNGNVGVQLVNNANSGSDLTEVWLGTTVSNVFVDPSTLGGLSVHLSVFGGTGS